MNIPTHTIILLVAIFCFSCTINHDIAGPGIETEQKIYGIAFYPDGSLAVNSSVTLAPADYLPGLSRTITGESAQSYTTATDSNGSFMFDIHPAHGGVIEISDGHGMAALARFSGKPFGRDSALSLTMAPQCTLSGVVSVAGAASSSARVRVYGLERLSVPQSDGQFSLIVPSGTYRLHVSSTDTAVVADTVSIDSLEAGSSRTIGAFTIGGLADGLVGYWPFDSEPDSVALDRSGNGLDGVIVGGVHVEGVCGTALDVSGGNHFVRVADTGAMTFAFGTNQDFTLSAWVKVFSPTPANETRQRIISRQVSNGKFYALAILDSTANFAIRAGNNDIWFELTDSVSLVDSAWHHIAGVRRGNMIQLYVDGRFSGEMAATAEDFISTADLHFGTQREATNWLDGHIDEIRIYDRALNPAGIALLADRQRCAQMQ